MNEKAITLTQAGRGRAKALLTLLFFSALVLGQTAWALPYSFSTIDSLGATTTFLFKMNDAGQFVGAHRDASGVLHSLITNGQTFTVFDPPGTWGTGIPGISEAHGINDLGQIVGYVELVNNDHAIAYVRNGTAFGFYDHPNAGSGDPFRGTVLTGINNAGVIVGEYIDNADVEHGFIQTGSVVTLFDDFWSGPGSQAVPYDINNLGQMVGSFFDVDGSGNLIQRGFFMDPSRSLLNFIDVLGSSSVFANGLNDLGDIVGAFYDDATAVFRGFVLSGGVLTVLDVPGQTGLLPGTFIHDIDNRGRLVGYYGDDLTRTFRPGIHGFLATPVPEPPVLALVGIGLVVMWCLRWREGVAYAGKRRLFSRGVTEKEETMLTLRFLAPGLTLAVLLLFASPRLALATLIDFDDVSVDGTIGNSPGILPGNQYASRGVLFRTGSLTGTVSVGGTVTLIPPSIPPFAPSDPIDEFEVIDTISSISSPNLAIARGGGLNDLLMIFTTPVTSVRLTSDDFPPSLGEAPDIIRLMALAPTSTPNQFTVLAFDEKLDNAVSSPDNLLSVTLGGTPFSYALFQVTTEQEGFDDLSFDPVRAVPEPPALALAGIGLVAMWRSRQQQSLNGKAKLCCEV
jgi:hypothetical protein